MFNNKIAASSIAVSLALASAPVANSQVAHPSQSLSSDAVSGLISDPAVSRCVASSIQSNPYIIGSSVLVAVSMVISLIPQDVTHQFIEDVNTAAQQASGIHNQKVSQEVKSVIDTVQPFLGVISALIVVSAMGSELYNQCASLKGYKAQDA